jgi:hypothetical protein
MRTLYQLALALHIATGIIGFFAFWTPAVARKGGTLHVRAGRVFFWATCVVAATGFVMATLLLIDPMSARPPRSLQASSEVTAAIVARIRLTSAFLYYLLLITFTPVYHGVRVLATRRAPERLRTPFHTAINSLTIAGSLAMILLGLVTRTPLFLFMSPIGFLIGWGNLQFARRAYPTPMAWWYEHMGAMLGGGVAFHTAFLVLGAGRLLGLEITGTWAFVPWLLPTLIGVPASEIWIRYYRNKFHEKEVQKVHEVEALEPLEPV